MAKTIEQYVAAYTEERDLDLVARNLAIEGADGGTISRVIRLLRVGDSRDYPGYSALYRALHRAAPNLAHEFSLRFAETAHLVARGDKPKGDLDACFRYYTQELALKPEERSAGIPPEPPRPEVSLSGSA